MTQATSKLELTYVVSHVDVTDTCKNVFCDM